MKLKTKNYIKIGSVFEEFSDLPLEDCVKLGKEMNHNSLHKIGYRETEKHSSKENKDKNS